MPCVMGNASFWSQVLSPLHVKRTWTPQLHPKKSSHWCKEFHLHSRALLSLHPLKSVWEGQWRKGSPIVSNRMALSDTAWCVHCSARGKPAEIRRCWCFLCFHMMHECAPAGTILEGYFFLFMRGRGWLRLFRHTCLKTHHCIKTAAWSTRGSFFVCPQFVIDEFMNELTKCCSPSTNGYSLFCSGPEYFSLSQSHSPSPLCHWAILTEQGRWLFNEI